MLQGVDTTGISLQSIESDVAKGFWSCCRLRDPEALGCKEELGHNTLLPKCKKCGQLFDIDTGRHANFKGSRQEACIIHPGVLEEYRFGGTVWSCCGSAGVRMCVRMRVCVCVCVCVCARARAC